MDVRLRSNPVCNAAQPSSLTLSASSTEYISPLPKHRDKLAGKRLYVFILRSLKGYTLPWTSSILAARVGISHGPEPAIRRTSCLSNGQPQWLSSTRHSTPGSSKDLYVFLAMAPERYLCREPHASEHAGKPRPERGSPASPSLRPGPSIVKEHERSAG